MKIFIVGANGQIGTLLTKELKDSNQYTPVAMIRKEEQKEKFDKLEVQTVVGDLEDPIQILAQSMQKCDAVVFTAGSGGGTGADKTLLIDLDGAVKTMRAAQEAGIDRFILVSAYGADNRELWNEEMKSYYVAKHYADEMVTLSDLHYTIIRPGMLTNEEAIGKIAVGEDALKSEKKSIPRIDVAKTIVECLNQESTFRKSFDLVTGKLAIEDAIEMV
ncbi:SDR family oxidoreductase [Lacticigenium naphthae]|uniref:SDR family oxidoreductase n=1 Tax=Lacticigenium naphthae TaxID=515351 RepID=UPI0003FD4B05|nr:SDR family oxidoreductase [Lacticigenium naphthae]